VKDLRNLQGLAFKFQTSDTFSHEAAIKSLQEFPKAMVMATPVYLSKIIIIIIVCRIDPSDVNV